MPTHELSGLIRDRNVVSCLSNDIYKDLRNKKYSTVLERMEKDFDDRIIEEKDETLQTAP